MLKPMTLVTLLTFAVSAVSAADNFDPGARARAIAPYLDARTIGLAHLDLTKVDAASLVAAAKHLDERDVLNLRNSEQSARAWLADFRKAGGQEMFFVFSAADLPPWPLQHLASFLAVPLQPAADVQSIKRLVSRNMSPGVPPPGATGQPPSGSFDATVQIGNMLFAGSADTLQRLRTPTPTSRPELVAAFTAAGDTTAQLLILPTADHRRVIEELLPTLPAEIGGGPSTAITRGLVWAAIGLDAAPKMSCRLVIQSQDPTSAKAFQTTLTNVYGFLCEAQQVRRAMPRFARVAPLLLPAIAGDRLTLTLDDNQTALTLAHAVLPALGLAGEPGRRAVCMNKLRQLGLAMHTYHDVHKRFPPRASFDKQGKPLLSWRVYILPFMDASGLYNEFHLDEPWDSQHNKKLIPRMPDIFRCPNQKTEAGKTCYLAPVGEKTIFPPDGKPVRFQDITDGTVNTILLLEVDDAHAVIWTKPDDLNYDPKNPLAGLLGHHEGGFNAVFADGSPRFLLETIYLPILRAMFTRSGNEPLEP